MASDWVSIIQSYEGGDVQCGTCATCIERREAMQEAGIIDPTIYKENA